MKVLLSLFLVIPLIEIYLLISIGGVIGAGMTILLIVFTAVLGAFLVRAQGFATFSKVQAQIGKGEVPAVEMMEGIFLFVAGALLLTPGFFTDAIGFLCLTPPLRKALIYRVIRSKNTFSRGAVGNVNGSFRNPAHGASNNPGDRRGRIIEGESRDSD